MDRHSKLADKNQLRSGGPEVPPRPGEGCGGNPAPCLSTGHNGSLTPCEEGFKPPCPPRPTISCQSDLSSGSNMHTELHRSPG